MFIYICIYIHMYIYIYVYVYICICICIYMLYIYIYVYTYICICIYIYLYLRQQIYLYIHIYVSIYISKCIHIYVCIYIHMHICICVCIYVYIYIYICRNRKKRTESAFQTLYFNTLPHTQTRTHTTAHNISQLCGFYPPPPLLLSCTRIGGRVLKISCKYSRKFAGHTGKIWGGRRGWRGGRSARVEWGAGGVGATHMWGFVRSAFVQRCRQLCARRALVGGKSTALCSCARCFVAPSRPPDEGGRRSSRGATSRGRLW